MIMQAGTCLYTPRYLDEATGSRSRCYHWGLGRHHLCMSYVLPQSRVPQDVETFWPDLGSGSAWRRLKVQAATTCVQIPVVYPRVDVSGHEIVPWALEVHAAVCQNVRGNCTRHDCRGMSRRYWHAPPCKMSTTLISVHCVGQTGQVRYVHGPLDTKSW